MVRERCRDRQVQRRIQSGLVAGLSITAAVLILLAPWLFDVNAAIVSPSELGSDLITKQWPNAAYIVRAWQETGELPLWRTAALGGVPIVGNPSMLLAYPPYWLIFLFPIGWAFTLYFALHLIWAGWGVYGLARRVIGLSPGAALLAALAFILSAKVIAHMGGGHVDVLAAVAWLPWLWQAADRLARQPSWPSVAWAAVAIAAQVVVHLPTLWMSGFVAVCWWLAVCLSDREGRSVGRWLRCVVAGLATLALTVGLAAVQIWPMLELLPLSTRGALTLAEATQYALPSPLLIGLLFPTALAFPEWVIYPGAVTLALAPASWLARRRVRGWVFLVAVVVGGVVFSLGRATPLYPVLFRLLPGLAWLRIPSRAMFLVQMSGALLAGMGWDGVRLLARRVPALVVWWIALLLLLAVGVAWTFVAPGVLAVSAGSLIVAVVAVAVLVWRSERAWLRSGALVALVLVEALILSPWLIDRQPITLLTSPSPVVRFLAAQERPFRVYSTRGQVSLIEAVAQGLETADGNDPFQFNHYVAWMNAASGCRATGYSVSVPTCAGSEVDPQAHLQARPDGAQLAWGNVRYVVTDHAIPQWEPPLWQSGALRVYENTAFLPRAVVVEDNAIDPQAARVTRWTPNRIAVEAQGPGELVISQVWAPGWRAAVDGAAVTLQRSHGAFCGLSLPAGFHTVELNYAPTGWVWGRWVSLAALVGVSAGSLWSGRIPKRYS